MRKNFLSQKNIYEGNWTYVNALDEAFCDADAIIIMTEWSDYLEIDQKVSKTMRQPAWVFDTGDYKRT